MKTKRVPLCLDEGEVLEMNFTVHATENGANIELNTVKRVIDKIELFSDNGASSLVYLVHFKDDRTDMRWILKEFYPISEEYLIKREGRKLVVNNENRAYMRLRESFCRGYERLKMLAADKEAAEYTTGIIPEGFAECNNTYYLLLPYKYATSFKMDSVPISDVYDVLIRSVICLDKYHKCGFLYLDFKEENIIYHHNNYNDKQKYIELFDCDTVVRKDELGKACYQLRSTPAYCAPEVMSAQQNGFTTTGCIDEKSDYYTVGAMLYHAIFKKPFVRTPDFRDTVEEWSEIINNEESLERCSYEYKQRLVFFFYKILHWRRVKRYDSANKIIADLERLKTLSKQIIHFKDANLLEDVVFIGREEQLETIAEHLEAAEEQHVGNSVVISAPGGLGKSALARRYALLHRRNYLVENDRGYDIILVSDYEGCKGIAEFISAVYERTVSTDSSDRMDFAGLTDMMPNYEQKKQILTTLCKRSRVLLIVDNFNEREADKDVNKEVMRNIGWDVIYTCRCMLEAFGTCIPLSDLGEAKTLTMFQEYFRVACENSYREFTEEENADIKLLLEKIDRHTMLAELFAKSAGAEEKVDGSTDIKALYEQFVKPYEDQEIGYTKDDNYSYGKINEIIGALYDKLPDSEVAQKILFHAALLSMPFTRDELMELKVITREQKGSVEYLYKSGWLRINDSDYYDDKVHYELHPVMEEVLYARFKDRYCEDNCGALIEGMLERLNKAFNCEDVVIREAKKKDLQIIKFLEKACEIGSLRIEWKAQLLYLCGSWNGICQKRENARIYLEQKRALLSEMDMLTSKENLYIDADIVWYIAKTKGCINEEEKNIILNAANKGYTRAMYHLYATYYYTNEDDAIKWLMKAAEGGQAAALMRIGNYCIEWGEEESKTGFDFFMLAAEKGLVDAWNNIGWCYAEGRGVNRNFERAIESYRNAAEQSCAIAQYNLGTFLMFGLGTDENELEGFKWVMNSAKQGYEGAQYTIAMCYIVGMGVERNLLKAREWFSKAAEKGHEKSLKYLDELLNCDFISRWSKEAFINFKQIWRQKFICSVEHGKV